MSRIGLCEERNATDASGWVVAADLSKSLGIMSQLDQMDRPTLFHTTNQFLSYSILDATGVETIVVRGGTTSCRFVPNHALSTKRGR